MQIHEGQCLHSYAFGVIYVRKLYIQKDTGEMCLDCKSDPGDILHLSMAYGRRLLVEAHT